MKHSLNNTPAALGYRMPAEWEPHEATIITWPHDERHWPGVFDQVPAIWARMVKEIETGEDVHLIIHDDATEQSARAEMKKAKVQGDRVRLHRMPNNFSWVRDNGPIVIKNQKSECLFLDWKYNAWGDQWPHDLDDLIPTLLARELGQQSLDVPMVLEGGSIDVNGHGTLITTENCLLNPNRNPYFTKDQIERRLKDHLGVRHILWLGEGIKGDDTSGHVDDLTRFVAPSTVVTIINENPDDPDHAPLQENFRRLKTMTDQDGRLLTVMPIVQPKPVLVQEQSLKVTQSEQEAGFRIPASYANFYIANECVLLPIWDDPQDAAAADVLRRCFPDRRIVPINSSILTWGFGSFHCVTQQIPL